MNAEPATEEFLEELERELAGLLSRLDDRDADPGRWREEARRWSERNGKLTPLLVGEKLETRLRPRIEALVRLNAIVRQRLAERLEDATRSIGCVRRARIHLVERGDGDTAARSCDVSA